MAINGALKVSIQILRAGEPAIGPGKALVLEAIDRAGSISAAGRAIEMSYRRIWLLVAALNRDWNAVVVETRPGGGHNRGAYLTPFGHQLLSHYRKLEASVMTAADGADLRQLAALLREPGASEERVP